MDLKHGSAAQNRVRVIGTSDYSLTKNSDIAIITAGIPRGPDESRLDLAKKNAEIIRGIAGKLVKYNNRMSFVISNPVDLMTTLLLQGLMKERCSALALYSTL